MSVSRYQSGPKVGSCRPVVVTFQEATAREEILAKAGQLKGNNIFISEDLSRTTRFVLFTLPYKTSSMSSF